MNFDAKQARNANLQFIEKEQEKRREQEEILRRQRAEEQELYVQRVEQVIREAAESGLTSALFRIDSGNLKYNDGPLMIRVIKKELLKSGYNVERNEYSLQISW